MLTNLSSREKVLLAILIAILTFFFGYKYILLPQYRHFTETKAQLEQARRQLQQDRIAAASLSASSRCLGAARKRYNSVEARFAAELRDGGAVVDIGLRAIASGVRITRWQAQDMIAKPYFLELPVNMELYGSYQSVLSFIDSLESRKAVPNLVSIRQLTLVAPQDNPGAGQSGTPGAAPPAGGAAPKEIQAKLSLVFYSQPTPAGRLALDRVAAWKVGRPDPYKEPALVSPYRGVAPLGFSPGVPAKNDVSKGAAGNSTDTGYPGWFPWPVFPGPPPGASTAPGGTAGQKSQPAMQETGRTLA